MCDDDSSTSTRKYTTHLSEFLHQSVETFGLRLGVGGHGAAQFELGLKVHQTSHVIGLFRGRLLQQRLFVCLTILCYFTLGGVCLTERLEENQRQRLRNREEKNATSVFNLKKFLEKLWVCSQQHTRKECIK